MGKRRSVSTVARLDPRIKAEVDRLVREGSHTIDEILEHLKSLGGEASRSAVGRYVKSARQQMEEYQRAQEIAKVWIGKLEADPQGDVGRLLSEMLKTISFQVAGQLGEGDGRASPEDVMLLSSALRNVGLFDKSHVEREIKLRERIVKEERERGVRVIDEVAQAQGMSEAQAKLWREKFLGVVTQGG